MTLPIVALLFAAQAYGDTATWVATDGLPPVAALDEEGDGSLLVGGEQGLFKFDGTKFTHLDVKGAPHFTHAFDHWLGADDGLRRLRDDSHIVRMGQLPGVQPLGLEPTRAMASELPTGVWVATPNHLYRHHSWGFTEVFDAHDAPISGVTSLAPTAGGMYAATADRVMRFAIGSVDDLAARHPELTLFFDRAEQIVEETSLPGMLAVDGDGTLWIGRADGLWRVRGAAELVDPRAVTAMAGPQIYVANPDGVFAVASGKLEKVLDHKSARVILVGKRAVWAADRDRLSLASLAGDTTPPTVRFGSYTISGIHPTGTVEPQIRPGTGRGVLAVEYTVAGAVGAHGAEFRYRLDGRDHDWIAAGNRTRTVYEDLPPGRYKFRVAARTPRSDWSNEQSLSFVLVPRYWQTSWFRALVFSALGLLTLALAIVLHVRRKRQEARAAAAVEKRVETEVANARETERLAAYGQMVAGVAHEVRQPLFAITTASYVLSQGIKDPELAPQVSLLEREVKRMSGMMDDLLDFARPAQLLKGPTDVAPLLAETLEIVRAEAEGDAELVVGKCDVEAITIDRGRMQQVLVNLVQNARRHAAGAKRIELSATADGDRVQLAVRDDGAAIPPERLARLFEPFFTTGKGTGLGLPIAKRIVELHDGTLTVTSDERGTCFTISIPGSM